MAAVGLMLAYGSGAQARSSVALGAYISGAPWDPSKIDEFSALVGTPPSVVMWYQDWAHAGVREFDPKKMDAVVSRGAMPMVTWEPWDYTKGVEQPEYALKSINRGKHDAYVKQWAREAAAWDETFYLRFAHEMNGNWNSWSPGVNAYETQEVRLRARRTVYRDEREPPPDRATVPGNLP